MFYEYSSSKSLSEVWLAGGDDRDCDRRTRKSSNIRISAKRKHTVQFYRGQRETYGGQVFVAPCSAERGRYDRANHRRRTLDYYSLDGARRDVQTEGEERIDFSSIRR